MPPTLLDRSRDFGEVWGAGTHRYEQDGRRFDAAGVEIIEEPELASADVGEDPAIGGQDAGAADDGVIDALQAAEDAIDQAQDTLAKKRKR